MAEESKQSDPVAPRTPAGEQYDKSLQHAMGTGQGAISTGKSIGSGLIKFTQSINAAMPYKIIFLIGFFGLFYNVIFNICIFFGIDVVLLNMYMGWVSFLLILFTFLPTTYGDIFTLNKDS
jgi:hypothetical protein